MFRLFICLALIADCVQSSAIDTKSKLKFSFYITSQCRDTRNFINQQLHPVYQELKEYLDVEFIPWGKSKRGADDKVTCQFGISDCIANKIQSCVFHLLGDDQAKQVDYVDCEMRTLFATQQNYQCANDVQVSTESAKGCYESDLSDKLEMQAEAKTKTITMVFVPTIVLDDKYDVNVQIQAFSNFKKFVCSLLKDEDPPACGSQNVVLFD